MPKLSPPTATPISDKAIQTKTGKTWDEWFKLLDEAGAEKMSHKDIVAHLADAHQVGDWWQQMITVGYEQARGLREKHERPEGFQISVSKTIMAPAVALFAAWADETKRSRWLPEAGFSIRKATQAKSMRITWIDGDTRVEMNLYPKGGNKCQITVQHSKLKDAEDASEKKAFWNSALEKLKAFLEDNSPNFRP
jgi:uncharacterized protein YndB with AHSA1/START domain